MESKNESCSEQIVVPNVPVVKRFIVSDPEKLICGDLIVEVGKKIRFGGLELQVFSDPFRIIKYGISQFDHDGKAGAPFISLYNDWTQDNCRKFFGVMAKLNDFVCGGGGIRSAIFSKKIGDGQLDCFKLRFMMDRGKIVTPVFLVNNKVATKLPHCSVGKMRKFCNLTDNSVKLSVSAKVVKFKDGDCLVFNLERLYVVCGSGGISGFVINRDIWDSNDKILQTLRDKHKLSS